MLAGVSILRLAIAVTVACMLLLIWLYIAARLMGWGVARSLFEFKQRSSRKTKTKGMK